ncbi:MAG: metallophosphoesterase [Phycisphaerales bacterium]|nr:MAG: metallophosphoesterase [Phycisphaerales bacterium]
MEKKRIYIADIHMNAGKGVSPAKGKHPYEWLGPEEAKRFAKFLEYLNDPGTGVQEVVIIGDLMDDWVYPVDIEPPSLQEILDAPINNKIVKALQELSENNKINVVYLPGNHDMGVTSELIEENFEGMTFGGAALYNSVYRTSRLRAEHGSAHAMFNAPPVRYGAGTRLPLGYFISRAVATKARNTGSAKRHYWSYADDLLEMVGPQKMAACVFEAVLEEAGLDETTEILMPKKNGKAPSATAKKVRKKTGKAKSATSGQGKRKDDEEVWVRAGEVKERYAALYDQWEEYNGKGAGFRAIMAETGLLGRVADRLCTKSDTNIVVFGHSHDWKLDKDAWFVKDRVYANCGTWCDEEKPCTWVESQKDRGKNRHIVRVMDWNNGKPKKLREDHVPL